MINTFSFHSDRSIVPPPNPIPPYLSIEDLNFRSFPRNFYNFTFAGYSCWFDKYYSRYRLSWRGYKGSAFYQTLSFDNPHAVHFELFSSFDKAVNFFRLHCLAIINCVLNGSLVSPVNSISAPLSDFEKSRRSRIVSRIFKTKQLLLPRLKIQREFDFDIF